MFDVVRMICSARILEKSISSIRKCFWTLFYFVLPDTDLTANRCYMRLITNTVSQFYSSPVKQINELTAVVLALPQ